MVLRHPVPNKHGRRGMLARYTFVDDHTSDAALCAAEIPANQQT
jgi:hypothetical protein